MPYLFNHWQQLQDRLIHNYLCIFLDYDGTLAPLAATPHQAVTPPATKRLVQQLATLPDCKVALISGRTVSDLKKLLNLKNLIYAGSHGLELALATTKLTLPLPEYYHSALKKIKAELNSRVQKISGVLLEDKGVTFCVHYRLVKKRDLPMLQDSCTNIIAKYKAQGVCDTIAGKKVLEIIPPLPWNKGKITKLLITVLRFALGSKKILPLYIGDDITDETAFQALKKRGLTIRVGAAKTTQAHYYIKNTRETRRLLQKILLLKRAATKN